MNRQQRRQKEREVKKNLDFLGKLTPEQLRKVDELTKQVSDAKMQEYGQIIQRSLTAALIEKDWTLDEIDIMADRMSDLITEDAIKTNILDKENVDAMKIEKEVNEYIEGLLGQGLSKKQAMNDLIFKFPKLSKSMLLNAYAKVKEGKGYTENRVSKEEVYFHFDSHAGIFNASQMIKSTMDRFGFTESTAQTYYYKWKKEYMSGAAAQDKSISKQPVNNDANDKAFKEKAEKIIKVAKEMQCSDKKEIKEEVAMENKEVKGLKIKSMVVEGSNGTYKVCEEGVELTKDDLAMHFQNIEQLDEFMAEFKEVFNMVK